MGFDVPSTAVFIREQCGDIQIKLVFLVMFTYVSGNLSRSRFQFKYLEGLPESRLLLGKGLNMQ